MSADLHNIELMELAARIGAGDVSPVAVTRAQLDRIAAMDSKLAGYALMMADVAMAKAEAAEAEVAFQFVNADLGEARLIRAGAAFQRATSWHRRHPDTGVEHE